jgi:NADH-quinone oxidoreductase subunit E
MTQTAATEANPANDIDLDFVRGVLDKYKGTRGNIIPVMQKVQVKFGYLPRPAVELISKTLRVSMAQLIGVASFYAQFRMTPRGKYMIKVCCGTACHVKGAQKLVEATTERFGVPIGVTTPDLKFTAERVACIGACSLAPVITVNDSAVGYLTLDSYKEILEKLDKQDAAAEAVAS